VCARSIEIVSVVAGHAFNLALTKAGKVYSWGRNEQGQVCVRVCMLP
jgi:alpha-tubulin suppressor-like RCC1 family protein